MSKSTRKFIAGLLSFAMVLTLVVGLAAAPAGAQTVTFTRNLTVGSRGADVMQLQTILQAKGFFTVEPTGYFGTITKRAVAAWQASEGISPAAGYFGPISRAQINAGTTTGGTTTTVPGCPAGAIYNYMTGALCSTTGGTTTGSNTEGILTVTQSATPANNANIQSNMDVPVYGLDLKAQLADVTVQRMDLDVSVTNGGSVENPGNFINTIKLLNGSTVVKSWSVGTADFVTGSSATQYYVRLSNIGFVVPKDTTKTLTVAVSTNGGIDNSRVVTIKGYGTNSLLAVSGNNINSYYDISGITRTHTFQKPGSSNLTVAADASNPLSQTYRVNYTSSSATNATLQTFSVKSDTGDSKITSITVLATTSNTSGPTALYLYDGSTLLGSVSASSTWAAQTRQIFAFNNLTLVVPKDTTKVLTVTGDFQPTTVDGTIASTTVSSVTYQKPNGTSATLSTTVAGNNQYFYSVSPQLTFLSGTASANTPINNQPSGVTGTFTFKVKPVGGSMTVPTANDFVVQVASSSSAMDIDTTGSVATRAGSQAVTVAGTPSVLAEGSEYTVTLTATVASTTLSSGNYPVWFKITGATSTIGSTTTKQTWGLGSFLTPSVTWSE